MTYLKFTFKRYFFNGFLTTTPSLATVRVVIPCQDRASEKKRGGGGESFYISKGKSYMDKRPIFLLHETCILIQDTEKVKRLQRHG